MLQRGGRYRLAALFLRLEPSRVLVSIRFLLLLSPLLLAAGGCGRLVFNPKHPTNTAMQQQIQTLAQQNQEYQTRAQKLDTDNQELESLLAQSRQQIQLLSDEVTATRQTLKETTAQLVAMQGDNEQLRSKTSQLVATVQKRAGAEIRANNSLLKNLAIKEMPGVDVRQDGDVVRVEIPGDRVFMPGSPMFQNGADQLLLSVAADLRRSFPDHIIGVEGHTDDRATHSQQYPTSHHLSAAQALAVCNLLTQRNTMPPSQLFVIGHGANHPVVSNASEEGKRRNRRIEFVVYPERIARR